MQIVQALEPVDWSGRKEFAVAMFRQTASDNSFLDFVVFSDVQTFRVSGMVNGHSCIISGSENPHCFESVNAIAPELNVWCAFSRHAVFGPCFIQEQTVQITCLCLLFAITQMVCLQPNIFFHQDGAPPSWILVVPELLNDI